MRDPSPRPRSILDTIVAEKRRDLDAMGPTLGHEVPARRLRPSVPFLRDPGVIFEIKRASPSKGDIDPGLDPATVAARYARSGASAVSVLTESRRFKGTLGDLASASAAEPTLSFLRKDFILQESEIEVSYRAGADAVLLIARILDETSLRRLAALCRSYDMTPFIELRDSDDTAKARGVAADGPALFGVNARDLATFRIDPLVPAARFPSLPGRAVYESGITTPAAAAYARRLGFHGALIGETAVAAPHLAPAIAASFVAAEPDGVGRFWRSMASRLHLAAGRRPLVKVCGLTRPEDALAAAGMGADLLGFVFAESPRAASSDAVRETDRLLRCDSRPRPLLVGVVTDLESEAARAAIALAADGYLAGIQWHGESTTEAVARLDAALAAAGRDGRAPAGRYAAVRLGSEDDIEALSSLHAQGEPRVLCDAKVAGVAGGTGARIDQDLAVRVSGGRALWLAGGLGPGTVGPAIDALSPELVDASSGLESSKGRKSVDAMKRFFREIEDHVR